MKAGPERNNLLDLLPQRAKERVFPLLREIELPLGKVLFASGQEVQYVYFPADCIVSLLNVMLDGHSAEISIVGCEGVLGVEVFMGGGQHTRRGRCPARRYGLPDAGHRPHARIPQR
jgi:hypothetical protein